MIRQTHCPDLLNFHFFTRSPKNKMHLLLHVGLSYLLKRNHIMKRHRRTSHENPYGEVHVGSLPRHNMERGRAPLCNSGPVLFPLAARCVYRLCCCPVKSCIRGELCSCRDELFLSNYSTAWSSQTPLYHSAVNSHNGAAQRRTMSQIPDRSPQVQRPS